MTNSETEKLVREVGQAMLADAIGQERSMGGVSYKLLALIALRAIHDAGFRVVPVEPTGKMVRSGAEAKHSSACDGGASFVGLLNVRACWPAMLAASPIQPEEGE